VTKVTFGKANYFYNDQTNNSKTKPFFKQHCVKFYSIKSDIIKVTSAVVCLKVVRLQSPYHSLTRSLD